MRCRYLIACAGAVLFGAVPGASAQAVDTIAVDSKVITVGTSMTSLPVRIVGTDPVSALAMTLQIGDGGPVLGGTEDLTIVGFDLAGSIFDPALFDLVFSPPGTPNGTVKVNISPNVDHPRLNVTANGLIGTIVLDTHLAASPRTVTISPTVADFDTFPFLVTNAQDSSLNDLSLAFSPGRLEIVVPEPGSSSLMAAGAIVLLTRRRRSTVTKMAALGGFSEEHHGSTTCERAAAGEWLKGETA